MGDAHQCSQSNFLGPLEVLVLHCNVLIAKEYSLMLDRLSGCNTPAHGYTALMNEAASKIEKPSRLSATDWAQGALAMIAEQGVSAVAVEPLARRLGVTKGSFYCISRLAKHCCVRHWSSGNRMNWKTSSRVWRA